MRSPRIALATYERRPEPTDDDAPLVAALRDRGAAVVALPWSADVAWADHDAVVLRSTWDYHRRAGAFLGWIAALEAAGVALWNPARLVRWNADKRYLRELAARGVAVVPTAWSDEEGERGLPAVAAHRSWSGPLVVKPAVSASAEGTWRTGGPPGPDDEQRYAGARRAGPVMVQPLLREVAADGEWSLIFIDGAFSHAVVKRPAAGDFRVQSEHGGSAVAQVPSDSLVADARRVLAAATEGAGVDVASLLYARVDGVARDGRLVLMELECIEPALFLGVEADAASRLAGAIVARVQGPPVTEVHGRASRQGHAGTRR